VGWILSALHQLNATGYAVAFAVGLVSAVIWKLKTKAVFFCSRDLAKFRQRFRRPFALAFLILAGMAILGGVLHSPSNYDGLAYRTPRVLQWLAEGRWHWIHTDFHRLNTRGSGFEWVTAPLIALFHTDRLLFIINAICFALLPGRVFSIWTHLGVRGRVAWYWMWLFPTGYCYLLQAGSIANDLFGALAAMAAIEFALRARRTRRISYVWLAVLAAGLMTAGKAFNLLLVLPWMVAIGPALFLMFRRPLISVLIVMMAASASLLPNAILNYRYCGDWTGQTAEHLVILGSSSPFFRAVVNSVLIPFHNLSPPIFPFSHAWQQLMQRVISPRLSAQLYQNFEPGAAKFNLVEMQMEEGAGLGLGVSVLLLATLIVRSRRRRRLNLTTPLRWRNFLQVKWAVPLAAWAGLGIFMTQSGLSCPARYLAPFYPFLIAPLLAGNAREMDWIWGKRWKWAGGMVFLLAGLLIVLCPPRPLWPAVTVLRILGADKSAQPLVKRAWAVYSVYSQRGNAFRLACARLPVEANPLGLVTSDDPETSLWKPFGTRRIIHICQSDTPEQIRQMGIKYILVSSYIVTRIYQISMDDWLARHDAEIVERMNLELRAGRGATEWLLVKMRDKKNN
jgi:hypothetical protein